MNTTYPQGPFQCPTGPTTVAPANMLCGSGTLGVDLRQLIIAPTVAYKINAQHAVGASLLLGYQRFKVDGAAGVRQRAGFPPFTGAPGNVTNNGYDSSTGVGLRAGLPGASLTDTLSIGAAYAPKMNMGKLRQVQGPVRAAAATSTSRRTTASASPSRRRRPWTIALDYEPHQLQRRPVGQQPEPPNRAPLGADNGPGFGWQRHRRRQARRGLAHVRGAGRCVPATTTATTRSPRPT